MITTEELRAARDAILVQQLGDIEAAIDTAITEANNTMATSLIYQTVAITPGQGLLLAERYKANGFEVDVTLGEIDGQAAVVMLFHWP